MRSRVIVLAGLTVLGVGLAGVGTAFGVTDPIANTGPNAEFVVSEENVTFSNAGETETVVDDISYVREVTIEEVASGRFTVSVEEDQPLTDTDRERAVAIARNDETVQRNLDSMDEYELTVRPVQKLESDEGQQANFTVTETDESGGVFEIEANNTTQESRDGSVVIEREPSYVDDRAVVSVQRPDADEHEETAYTIDVDLANETVTDVTDWREIRRNATASGSTTGPAERP